MDGNWIRIVSTNAPIRFYNDGGAGTNVSLSIESGGRLFLGGREIFSDRIVSTNGSYSFVMQTDRNVVLYQSSGAVWATGTNVSDVSLKKQITPLASPLEKVLNLRGVAFHWKDETMGTEREIGVIAQELEQVFPELVKSIDDRKFVKYEGLAPVLIEAIKEQQALISQMKEEIQNLKQSFQPAT